MVPVKCAQSKHNLSSRNILLFHIHTTKRSPEIDRFPTAIPAVQSHHQRPKMHFPIGPTWGPALSSSWYPQACKTVVAVSGITVTPYKCLSAIHDLVCYFSLFLEAEKIFQKQLTGLAFLSHGPGWTHSSKGNSLPKWACSNQPPPPPIPRLTDSVPDTPTTVAGLFSAGIPIIMTDLTWSVLSLPQTSLCGGG